MQYKGEIIAITLTPVQRKGHMQFLTSASNFRWVSWPPYPAFPSPWLSLSFTCCTLRVGPSTHVRKAIEVSDLGSVVSQPVVSFPEIVEYNATTIAAASWQHDGRTWVRLGRDPRTVKRVRQKKHSHHRNYSSCHLHSKQIGQWQQKLHRVSKKVPVLFSE